MCVSLPKVKTCCCVIPLWLGCVIIGVIIVLEGVLILTGVLREKRRSRMELDNVVEGVMLLTLGGSVLIGVVRKMAVLLNVPAIVIFIMLAVFLVLEIMQSFQYGIDLEFINAVVMFCLNMYFVVILCSYSQELE